MIEIRNLKTTWFDYYKTALRQAKISSLIQFFLYLYIFLSFVLFVLKLTVLTDSVFNFIYVLTLIGAVILYIKIYVIVYFYRFYTICYMYSKDNDGVIYLKDDSFVLNSKYENINVPSKILKFVVLSKDFVSLFYKNYEIVITKRSFEQKEKFDEVVDFIKNNYINEKVKFLTR